LFDGCELTSYDTNWKRDDGATPLGIQDLFFGDAISLEDKACMRFLKKEAVRCTMLAWQVIFGGDFANISKIITVILGTDAAFI
jgi:hypothetical protein